MTLRGTPAEGATTNQKAVFTFSSPATSRFQCSRDHGTFAACVSPVVYGFPMDGSAEGLHTFSVRGLDVLRHPGPVVTRTFFFDSIPPKATIVSSSPPDGAISNDTTWTLNFTANEANVTFECLFDGDTTVSPCVSGETFPMLEGVKTAVVRATDAAGNVGPFSNQVSYTLDVRGPNLVNIIKPATHSGPRVVTVSWGANEAATYRCTFIHVNNPVPCENGSVTVMEIFGTNNLDVIATDVVGNLSSTAVVWTVN